MNIGTLNAVWTVLVFVVFIGIVWWAWSGKNKAHFEQAARMPLDDDDGPGIKRSSRKENHHA